MEVKIDIEDYLSESEMKDIAKEEFALFIRNNLRKESDFDRILTNLSYEYIFKAISEETGKDVLTYIKDKIETLLQDDSHISYLLWRKKDAWENEESPAITIMNQAIKDNHEFIENKVHKLIDNYNFDEIKDEIYDILCESLSKQLFGK